MTDDMEAEMVDITDQCEQAIARGVVDGVVMIVLDGDAVKLWGSENLPDESVEQILIASAQMFGAAVQQLSVDIGGWH